MKDQFKLGISHRIFNNEVRKRREELGFSQEQLANAMDIPRVYVGQIENFKRYPTYEQALKFEIILDCKKEILFPNWLKDFKPSTTKIVTEHIITEPLISAHTQPQLLIESLTEQEDSIDKDLLRQAFKEPLSTLSSRERKVLELRYGLKDGIERTLEETAELIRPLNKHGNKTGNAQNAHGVTKERVRQIEQKALRRLRHPSRGKKLKKFLK